MVNTVVNTRRAFYGSPVAFARVKTTGGGPDNTEMSTYIFVLFERSKRRVTNDVYRARTASVAKGSFSKRDGLSVVAFEFNTPLGNLRPSS